jgi:hypothetical protein
MNKTMDLILIYQFMKRLTTPFDKTEAFKLGIIDKNGKRTDKKIETKEEEKAYGYFDRLTINIKRLLEQLPGGKSKLASYAAALFLIRESANPKEHYTQQELAEGLMENMDNLEESTGKTLEQLMEDAPATSTAGVVGTGDDVANWKPDARKKEMKAFLRRYIEQKNKRQKIKERKDFLKKMGL